MNENELETIPEIPPDTVSDPVSEPETPEVSQPEASEVLPEAAEEPANDTPPENPVNTGLPDPAQDQKNETNEESLLESEEFDSENEPAAPQDEADGEEAETGEGDGSTTNITIVRPAAQPAYYTDEEGNYRVIIENGETDPVPVIVMETLTETGTEPGIMDKRLEDYTVTEGLLLCILIVLILHMVFEYGRRFF